MKTPQDLIARPWLGIEASGPLLRPAEAAKYLGLSLSRFYAISAQGDLPKPIKIGRSASGATGVPLPWLNAVIAARAAESDQV